MRTLLVLLTLTTTLPGAKRLELGFPQFEERVQVVFPENYDPSKKWPAVFYYHGTNGKPTTELITAHTAGQDWFVVGLTYVQRGPFTYSEETLQEEWRILHSVRKHLATKWNLDSKRVYVAGFSKGGWVSGFMLQRDRDLAGAIILGAGHIHSVHQTPRKFPTRKPLFVGVGRKDGNYPFSLRALTFYRPLGVQTTFDTWHELGHAFPAAESPALKQWLAIEAHPRADHKPAAKAWMEERIDKIKGLPDLVDQWVAMRDLEATPYLRVLGDTWKTKIKDQIADLEKGGRVAAEAKALAEHRTLLRKEMGKHTDKLYQALLGAYLKLSETHSGTRQAEIALGDYERVKRLLQHFREQDKIAKEKERDNPFPPADEKENNPFPKLPTKLPVIPRNPLIR
jgi:predicted esterase